MGGDCADDTFKPATQHVACIIAGIHTPYPHARHCAQLANMNTDSFIRYYSQRILMTQSNHSNFCTMTAKEPQHLVCYSILHMVSELTHVYTPKCVNPTVKQGP